MVVGTCTALAMHRTPTKLALAVELGDTSEGVEGGAGPQREALAGRSGFHWRFVNRPGSDGGSIYWIATRGLVGLLGSVEGLELRDGQEECASCESGRPC